MRDILLTAVVFGTLPFVLTRPYIGIYLWAWLGFMNPQRLTWGFAFTIPFAQIVAVVILVATLASREEKRIPWTRETITLLVLNIWMLFTTFFAFYQQMAWQQGSKVWKIQLMIYITLMLINTKQKLDGLIWVIVLSLGFYGVKGGIFTVLTGGNYRVWGPPGSFIGGNNEIGLALIMTIPLMRYLQLQVENTWVRHGMTIMMVLSGIAAIGTQSRGALLGIVAMGSIFWVKGRNKAFIFLAVMMVAGATLSIMPQEWYDRMYTIKSFEEDGSAMGRIHSWRTAFNIASDRVTGGGFETFHREVFAIYAPNPENVHDVHSIYFEMIGEHGFIGFALFMMLALFTWNTGTRIKRNAKRTQNAKWAGDLAGLVQVSMFGYAVSGAFLGLAYFDLYYNLIAIMVICGVLFREQASGAPSGTDTVADGAKDTPVKYSDNSRPATGYYNSS